MIISFEPNGCSFLDDDTFVVFCEWTKNINKHGEPMFCEIEAELHLDTKDEFIGINFFDYNGEFVDCIDARKELTEDECQDVLTMLYNEYGKAKQ